MLAEDHPDWWDSLSGLPCHCTHCKMTMVWAPFRFVNEEGEVFCSMCQEVEE